MGKLHEVAYNYDQLLTAEVVDGHKTRPNTYIQMFSGIIRHNKSTIIAEKTDEIPNIETDPARGKVIHTYM